MLSTAGSWRFPPDDLDSVRRSAEIGVAVRVMGSAGGESVYAEGWIIGWLDGAGHLCSREAAAAVRLQVFRTNAARLTSRVILVPYAAPSTLPLPP